MTGVLACAYAVVGYWYFWQVLKLAGTSAPGDVVGCALLGLLFGPVLLVSVLCLRVLTSVEHPHRSLKL
jgi:hypothetical protein